MRTSFGVVGDSTAISAPGVPESATASFIGRFSRCISGHAATSGARTRRPSAPGPTITPSNSALNAGSRAAQDRARQVQRRIMGLSIAIGAQLDPELVAALQAIRGGVAANVGLVTREQQGIGLRARSFGVFGRAHLGGDRGGFVDHPGIEQLCDAHRVERLVRRGLRAVAPQ